MLSRFSVLGISCVLFAQSSAIAQDKKGEDDVSTCLSAHEDGQVLRRSANLKQARETLLKCSRAICPSLVRADCVEWLGEVERSAPTVVVSARVGKKDEFDVTVFIDGQLVTKRLDGKPVILDPGIHTFKLQLEGWPDIERQILIASGEKNRVLDFNFGPPEPEGGAGAVAPPPIPMHRPVKPITYILGGAAVVGFAGFGVFAVLGNSEKNDLKCRPFCTDNELDPVKSKYLIADISLGAGAALAVASLVTLLTRPSVPLDEKDKEEVVPEPDQEARINGVDFQPGPSGGLLNVSGQF